MSERDVSKSRFQAFRYVGFEKGSNAPKRVIRLGRTDILKASVQFVQEDGTNNLHSHAGEDGFWMVLTGEATFYDQHDEVVAVLGPSEGIVTPRNLPYWFESSGGVPLEVLHLAAVELGVENLRVDHRPRNVRGRAPA